MDKKEKYKIVYMPSMYYGGEEKWLITLMENYGLFYKLLNVFCYWNGTRKETVAILELK